MYRNPEDKRVFYIHARLTEDEYSRMKLQMEQLGHRSISGFLRELIMKRRIPSRIAHDAVSDEVLREKMNVLIYHVNKIGVNYNQIAATYQRQAKQIRPDGTPYLNTHLLDAKMTELMRCTAGLRDEFAVILEIIKRYINKELATSFSELGESQ